MDTLLKPPMPVPFGIEAIIGWFRRQANQQLTVHRARWRWIAYRRIYSTSLCSGVNEGDEPILNNGDGQNVRGYWNRKSSCG
jgi:hypothetical protein